MRSIPILNKLIDDIARGLRLVFWTALLVGLIVWAAQCP